MTKNDAALNSMEDAVNTFSSPSDLRITDMRTATVCSNYDYPIIRIDTNQGVYGLGEVDTDELTLSKGEGQDGAGG